MKNLQNAIQQIIQKSITEKHENWWRQKGTTNHRSLNLFEKGWLSADVGFTMVKRSILKIKGPKINIKNTIQQTKNMVEIGMQNILKN